LTSLVLSFNDIGNVGAAALARSLERNTALTKLWLPANRLGNGAIRAFGESLPEMRGLKQLNLGDIFDNVGAMSILEGLRYNVELDTLLMESILFDDNAIAAEIELYLSANKIGRRILRDPQMSSSIWPLMFARANDHECGETPNALYYFIRQKPEVFSHLTR
jgi:hypothetical protein